MELPIVDNEFLSLFLPENSQFSTDEILEDFKYYIFIIMKMSVDSLIQEQINNEYQIGMERRTFKSFFSERINKVLEINNLYMKTQNRADLIKNSCEKNRSIIEDNREPFSSEKIISEINNLTRNIQANKSISSKNSFIVDLLSIPYQMINCVRNSSLNIYLEYREYINLVNESNGDMEHMLIIKTIKNTAHKVNKVVCDLLVKMLTQDNEALSELSYEEINDVLQLEMNESINDKKVNATVYQLSLYFKELWGNLNEKSPISKFQQFFKFVIVKVKKISDSKEYTQIVIGIVLEKYILPLTKILFSNLEKFKERKNLFLGFIRELTAFTDNSSKENLYLPYNFILNQISEIINANFYLYLEHLFNLNKNSIKRYLQGVKDIKKLLVVLENQGGTTESKVSSTSTSTSASKFNPPVYEVLLILYNNLSEIYNTIINDNIFIMFNLQIQNISIKEKKTLLEKFEEHLDAILSIIQNFFYDNLFLLKFDSLSTEIDNFKSQLMNFDQESGIMLLFLKDFYSLLGLRKYFDLKILAQKKASWDNSFLIAKLEQLNI